jgi:hypothetical protein
LLEFERMRTSQQHLTASTQVVATVIICLIEISRGDTYDWDPDEELPSFGDFDLKSLDLPAATSLLDALLDNKDCTNEEDHCRVTGFASTAEDPRCFSACLGWKKGCRSCCLNNTCFLPGINGSGVPSCGKCDLLPETPSR